MKLAVELPAPTVTWEGTLTAELLSARFTTIPFAGAFAVNLTEHVVDPGPWIEGTLQLTEVSCDCAVAGWMVIIVEAFVPAELATTMADVSDVTVAAVAGNCAVVCPAGTVVDAGTVSPPLLLESETGSEEVAAFDKATMQLAMLPDFRLAGVQTSELRTGPDEVKVIPAVFEMPFKLAVTVAAEFTEMVPALAEKEAAD